MKTSLFLRAAVLLSALVVAGTACADVIQSTPSLPPQGYYVSGTICIQLGPGVCVVNPSLSGFNGTTSTINGMGQAIDSNISFDALIYTDNNGMPGTLIGPLHASGPIGILYADRTSDNELGSFTSTLTELDLTGTFNGHSLEVMLTSTTSSGNTTVSQQGSDFRISSFFDVFTEISIDHGNFIQGPERHFVLTTPEPGSASLLLLGLLSAAGEIRRRMADRSR